MKIDYDKELDRHIKLCLKALNLNLELPERIAWLTADARRLLAIKLLKGYSGVEETITTVIRYRGVNQEILRLQNKADSLYEAYGIAAGEYYTKQYNLRRCHANH